MNSINPDPNPVETAAKPISQTCPSAKISFYLGIGSLIFGAAMITLLAKPASPPFLLPSLFLAWIAAAICAVFASSRARNLMRADAALSGKGWAWAGALIGYANLLFIVAAIVLPNFAKARTVASPNACVNNLRQFDGAKQQWALEHKKTTTDTPTFADLIGTDKFIKFMPICPANGTYSLRDMASKPVCSIPGHTLP